MKPEIAVGTREPMGRDGFVKACQRCLRPVYMHDVMAAECRQAICVECFIESLEDEPDSPLTLVLPPGVTPQSMVRFLRGEIPTPFVS